MNWRILKTSGFLLFLVTFFVGCNNPHPGFDKTDSGIYYQVITQVDSLKDIKADSGQFFIMEMKYGTADSIVFNSEALPEKITKMPFRDKEYDGDVWEALALLSKGDSTHFIIRADSFFLKTTRAPQIPELFKESNEVHFFVNIKNIMSKAEMDAERATFVNARRFAEPIEIEKFKADYKWEGEPLESGLNFNKIKSGKGLKVKDGMFLTFDFEIRYLDGRMLYSSIEANRPPTYEYGKNFDTKGIMEALGMMRAGDEVELIIPSSLAYGEQGNPRARIEPFTALHYFVRLNSVKTKAENDKEIEAKRKNDAAILEATRLQEASVLAKYIAENEITIEPTESGLYFLSTLEGEGEQAVAGNKVKVHYTGTLLDGTKFDSSVDRDQPFEFVLGQGQVIKGWDEGIAMMKVGGKATFILPSSIAYGERQAGAVIKPYSPLKFDVELLEIITE